jgi:hypothetical protein
MGVINIRRAVGGLVVVCILTIASPASADAFSLSGFRAVDEGSTIRWAVTVCGAKGAHVALHAVLENADNGIQYSRGSSGTQRYDCTRWSFGTDDIWTAGLWYTQLTVSANGSLRRTGVKGLYID